MYFNLLRYYTVHQHFQPWFLYHSTHPILFSESIWIKITKQFETTLEENDHHDESDGNRKNHGWIWHKKKSPIRIMYESNTSRKITEKSGIIGNWKYIIKHERIWHGRKKQGQIWHVKKDYGRILLWKNKSQKNWILSEWGLHFHPFSDLFLPCHLFSKTIFSTSGRFFREFFSTVTFFPDFSWDLLEAFNSELLYKSVLSLLVKV